jgi:hypothetical protein
VHRAARLQLACRLQNLRLPLIGLACEREDRIKIDTSPRVESRYACAVESFDAASSLCSSHIAGNRLGWCLQVRRADRVEPRRSSASPARFGSEARASQAE